MNVVPIHHKNATASVGRYGGGKSNNAVPPVETVGCVAIGSAPYLLRILRWSVAIAFHFVWKLVAQDKAKRTVSQSKVDMAIMGLVTTFREWIAEFSVIR